MHLKVNKLIHEFMAQDSEQAEKLRQRMQIDGNTLDDESLVRLVVKRIA